MVIRSLLALLTLFSLSRRNLPNVTESVIKRTILMYGYNMRALIQVLQVGPTKLEQDIQEKVRRLETVRLINLMKLDADDTGNVSHNLLVIRCPEQPKPGTLEYLDSDVPTRAAASHAVMKKLILVHGRMVYLDTRIMLELSGGGPSL